MTLRKPAVLVLEDGSLFRGLSIGAETQSVGEVVFNTAMTGYQEILTDPSYRRQLVTMTYPHIGNVGVNPEDEESPAVQAAGLVIRDLPPRASNWRQREDLEDYLRRAGVPGIADIVKVMVPSATAPGVSRFGILAARNRPCAIGTITNSATKTLTPP